MVMIGYHSLLAVLTQHGWVFLPWLAVLYRQSCVAAGVAGTQLWQPGQTRPDIEDQYLWTRPVVVSGDRLLSYDPTATPQHGPHPATVTPDGGPGVSHGVSEHFQQTQEKISQKTECLRGQ